MDQDNCLVPLHLLRFVMQPVARLGVQQKHDKQIEVCGVCTLPVASMHCISLGSTSGGSLGRYSAGSGAVKHRTYTRTISDTAEIIFHLLRFVA